MAGHKLFLYLIMPALLIALLSLFPVAVMAGSIQGECKMVICFNGKQYPCGFDCKSLLKKRGSSGSSGSYIAPSTPRKPTAAELENEREWATHDYNEAGFEAYQNGQWAKAVRYFSRALEYDPYNLDIEDNLKAARDKLRGQEYRLQNRARDAERQRVEAEKKRVEAERKVKLISIEYELLKTENRIEKTRQKLKSLSKKLPGYQKSMDEWTSMGIKARREAHEAALDNVATFGLFWLSARKQKQVKLSKDILNRTDGLIKRKILGKPFYSRLSAKKKLAIERLGKAKTEADAVSLLKEIKGITGDVKDLTEKRKDRENLLTGMLSIITLVAKDPRYELLIADAKLATADVYAYMAWNVARKRINQLLKLSELQLKEVNSLSRLYKADIENRKKLKAEKSKMLAASK